MNENLIEKLNLYGETFFISLHIFAFYRDILPTL